MKIVDNIVDKLLRKDKTDNEQVGSIALEANMPVIDKIHDIAAESIAKLARLTPDDYSSLKTIMKAYTLLIVEVMNYRINHDPSQMFLRIQEFLMRSLMAYTKDNEKEAITEIVRLFISSLNHAVEESERKEVAVAENNSAETREAWQPKQVGRPSKQPVVEVELSDDDDIELIKGIGKKRAIRLRKLEINTVGQYKAYMSDRSSNEEEEDEEDDE